MSPAVLVAVTFGRRYRGLRAVAPGMGLMLWGRSVHGKGMYRPLRVLRISADGRAGERCSLEPGSVVRFDRAGWLLELPVEWDLPPPGTPLRVRPMLR